MNPPDQTTRNRPSGLDAPSAPARDSAGVRRPRFPWRAVAALLAFVLLVVLGIRWLMPGVGTRRAEAPPQPVGIAEAARGDLRVVLTGLGTVTPLATVTVQTQISGQLVAVGFREGQYVKAGDFLAQIDPRPYQVALAQAQATLARDQALLAQARADLARYVALNARRSIAVQQVSDQQFLVQQYQGTVAIDQASVNNAKLNLVYCHITAPVTGRVGLRLVDPGNYVQTASSTGLVVITQLQPISVIFVLPESDVSEAFNEMQQGRTLVVDAYDRTNTEKIASGILTVIDNAVDTTTGTVKFRAVFPNADNALFPNEFVNARLLVRTLRQVLEVPTAAIQHGAPGTFVYKLDPAKNTVAVQVIETGVSDGDATQVTSGLAPGDSVVVDGVDRLRDGAAVRVTH